MAVQTSLKTLLIEHTAPAAEELVRAEGDGIRCFACGHRCLVRDGRDGVCRVRFNEDGVLKVPFGYIAALQMDPIEKKPFYHAYPGRDALSFGMLGCDYHCGYCQNWVTSQALRDDQAVSLPKFCSPEQLAELAVEHEVPVIVSTYNEPLITSEWAVAVFQEARKRGITCGYVSNGNGTIEVLRYLRPYVDLYKVDLKGFDDKHYRELGGVLGNVLATIENLVEMKFWLEISDVSPTDLELGLDREVPVIQSIKQQFSGPAESRKPLILLAMGSTSMKDSAIAYVTRIEIRRVSDNVRK